MLCKSITGVVVCECICLCGLIYTKHVLISLRQSHTHESINCFLIFSSQFDTTTKMRAQKEVNVEKKK